MVKSVAGIQSKVFVCSQSQQHHCAMHGQVGLFGAIAIRHQPPTHNHDSANELAADAVPIPRKALP